MKNFITRTLSGAVYVALIIASILVSKYTFAAFFALLLVIAMHELDTLVRKESQAHIIVRIIDYFTGLAIFASTFAVCNLDIDPTIAAVTVIPCILVRFVAGLYLKEQSPIISWAYSIFNIIYVAAPLAILSVIYSLNPYITLIVFALIWINDTGAFLVGCTTGKHKMFPRISPKKSWEGFAGGFVLCIIACVVADIICESDEPVQWILLGAIASIFATWGDLVESLIKRTVGVKDSGKIMPGHGGILDRIDSLLMVAPALLAYLLLIKQF